MTRHPESEDCITLTGLEIFAHHGLFAEERRTGQRFIIDAQMRVSLHSSAHSDNIEHTVHYGEVADAIVTAVSNDPVDLIETLAERVAQRVLEFQGVRSVTITVHKPDAPIAHTFADVAVTITRSADSARPAASEWSTAPSRTARPHAHDTEGAHL